MLAESGVGDADDIRRAAEESARAGALRALTRSVLDRQAAKEALAGFLNGKSLGANQIEFVEPDRGPSHRTRS
jgi:hypothetical protein